MQPRLIVPQDVEYGLHEDARRAEKGVQCSQPRLVGRPEKVGLCTPIVGVTFDRYTCDQLRNFEAVVHRPRGLDSDLEVARGV